MHITIAKIICCKSSGKLIDSAKIIIYQGYSQTCLERVNISGDKDHINEVKLVV